MTWRPKDDLGAALEARWKQFEDGLYVEVSIVHTPDGFVVRSLSECRTSGPSETISTTFASLEAALQEAERRRVEWDTDGTELDLTSLQSL